MQFEDLADPIAKFDSMMRESLPSMYEELLAADYYVREHEVVNLFVFGHLVPLFLRDNLDLRQIGIEYPVKKLKTGARSKPGARKDLVIWPRSGATLWNGHHPLAIVEWKHISRITGRPVEVRAAHLGDINWLQTNREMMQVGYAILVERSLSGLTLNCVRVQGDVVSEFAKFPGVAVATANSHK
jgi:hypothetical protein